MKNDRELVIAMDEAETELMAAVNSILQKHGLPFFIFEPIVDKIHRQIISGKEAELEAARSREASAAAAASKEGNK